MRPGFSLGIGIFYGAMSALWVGMGVASMRGDWARNSATFQAFAWGAAVFFFVVAMAYIAWAVRPKNRRSEPLKGQEPAEGGP